MSDWTEWQILSVMAIVAAKFFLLGWIWGGMRATRQMQRALMMALNNPRGAPQ